MGGVAPSLFLPHHPSVLPTDPSVPTPGTHRLVWVRGGKHVPCSGHRQLPDPAEAAGAGAGEGECLSRQQQPEQQQRHKREAQQAQRVLACQIVWIEEETEEKAAARCERGEKVLLPRWWQQSRRFPSFLTVWLKSFLLHDTAHIYCKQLCGGCVRA